jgi:hypothetical protein
MRDAPGWLYERLPYVYILTGLLATSGIELTVSTLSGAVLVVVGLIVFRLRLRYRALSAQRVLLRISSLS